MNLRRLFSLLGILILLVGLAFAVYLAQQNQELRRRASFEPITLQDNFDGAALNTSIWGINGTEWQTPNSVVQDGGKVTFSTGTVTSTYHSAGLASNSFITDDYTMEVTVSNLTKSGGPTDDTSVAWTSLVLANDATGNYNTLGLWIRGNGDRYVKVYNQVSNTGAGESSELPIPTSATSVKLKLTRVGSTIQAFADFGSGYQLVGNISNAYAGDGNIQMDTFADPIAGLSASAAYDNLLAQVTPIASASPSPSPSPQTSPSPSPSALPDIGGGEDCDAPIAPQNVKARTGSKSGEIIISWLASPGASHYGVTYGTTSGNYLYGAPNVGNIREYVVRGLNPDTTYYLVATAVNDCGSSPYSRETSAVAVKSSGGSSGSTSTPTPSTTTFLPSLPSSLPTLDLPSSIPSPSPEPSPTPELAVSEEPETPQGPNRLIYIFGALIAAAVAFFFIKRRQNTLKDPNIVEDPKPSAPPETPTPPQAPPSQPIPPLPSAPTPPTSPSAPSQGQ